jgi:hypothetical protein
MLARFLLDTLPSAAADPLYLRDSADPPFNEDRTILEELQ